MVPLTNMSTHVPPGGRQERKAYILELSLTTLSKSLGPGVPPVCRMPSNEGKQPSNKGKKHSNEGKKLKPVMQEKMSNMLSKKDGQKYRWPSDHECETNVLFEGTSMMLHAQPRLFASFFGVFQTTIANRLAGHKATLHPRKALSLATRTVASMCCKRLRRVQNWTHCMWMFR